MSMFEEILRAAPFTGPWVARQVRKHTNADFPNLKPETSSGRADKLCDGEGASNSGRSQPRPVFNCRFVASEFSTGAQHAGRIDTLALSEDNNPVIIEYKKVKSSELINQSILYLAWLND